MDSNKYLIIIKGEDKTEDVIKFQNKGNKYIEIFYKNSKEAYTHLQNDFKFYNASSVIDITNQKCLLYDTPIYNLDKVISFKEFYKLYFKDKTTKIVKNSDLKLINIKEQLRHKSSDKFECFKEISKVISIKTDDDIALLTREYDKINYIENDTALYKYLNPNKELNKNNVNFTQLIFPFGSNKSQFNAVRNAMENQISIIEGPPGTGKTQTILNIIANIVKEGKTVAVVSNNNAATDNVYEKLEDYGLNYLCARLGKKENKEKFFREQTGEYPEFKPALENKFEVEEKIAKLNYELHEIFNLQNSIAKLKEQLNQVELEHRYFNEQELSETIKVKSIKRMSSNNILRLKVECEDLEHKKENINLWFKLKSYVLYGIGGKNFYKKPLKDIIQYYNKLFFVIKELEIKEDISEKSKKLALLGNEEKLELLKLDSIKIFNEYLRKKYCGNIVRKKFDITDLYIKPCEFSQEYPIVLSTTHSIKNCLNFNYRFDYIIMDESSQVDLVTGVLALSVAKNAVIVGDEKQLPNVTTRYDKEKVCEILKEYDINDSYNYVENSFLTSIRKTIRNIPKTMLKEHYRCHPKIIGFCNKKFYNDELIIMTEDNNEGDVLKAFVTVKGNHARGHFNQRQIDVIDKEILPEIRKKVSDEDIGIISPYRQQKDKLENTFDDKFQIDTVHKFQGREKEAIIITTVDNEIGKFVDNANLLNVAVTRAKSYLRLVVSNNEKNQGTNIDDLLKYINYNNFEITQSNIKSIYDLLYKSNQKERLEFFKNKKRMLEYDSENLTNELIKEILNENNYDNLDFVAHIPLSNILKNMNLLDDREKTYAMCTWTHIDFVIYNKMDKEIFMALEVDGYHFHKEGTEQEKRDRLKDRILEKYDIPLTRLSTIGSEEREKLKNEIERVFRKKSQNIL